MRSRLLRGLTAALVAVAVILPVSAQPAQAIPQVVIDKVKDLAEDAIIDLIKNAVLGGGGPSEIEQAVQQIVAAIEASQTVILNHIDQVTAAQVRACARHHVIEFEDIALFNQTTLQRWAQDATGCAVLAESQIQAGVTSKLAIDRIGFALNVVGPIALAARVEAGFSTTGLMDVIDDGNRALITKLKPACTFTPLWGDAAPGFGPVEVIVRCTAYDGNVASGHIIVFGERGRPLHIPESKYAHIADAATKFTSRAIAQAVVVMIAS